MKARLCLVASVLLLASPAFAQEPLEAVGSEGQSQSDTAAPGMDQAPPAATAPTPTPPPAPAQEAAAPSEVDVSELTMADDNQKLVSPWGVPVDEIAQMDVYDKNGKKIGEVDAVLQDKDGEIKGVAIGYGGFLGFGEKGAIVTLDQVQLKDGTLVTNLDEDQLSQLPAWLKK